ncbi:MAG: hypothetical protein HRT57_16195 [Crocinitomicaceae bacterium]|nr:hypothetical protein [Crocinitomicaceae bacterium]
MIQKRKFNKGWHINRSGKTKADKGNINSTDKELTKTKVENNEALFYSTTTQEAVPKNEAELTLDPSLENNTTDNHSDTEFQIDSKDQTKEVTPISPKEVEPETSRMAVPKIDKVEEAQKLYKKAWVFTIFAIIGLICGILLLLNAFFTFYMIMALALLGGTLTAYFFMFLNLIKTTNKLVGKKSSKEEGRQTKRLAWAHIIIGSLFLLPLFFLPIMIAIIEARGTKKFNAK